MTPVEPAKRRHPLTFVSVTALPLFVLLGIAVESNPRAYFDADLSITTAVQSASWPGTEDFMRAVSWAGDGNWIPTLVVSAAALVLLLLGRRRDALIMVVIVLIAHGLKVGIKELIARPRPQPEVAKVFVHPTEIYSFPSGHTTHYTVFFGYLAFLSAACIRNPAVRWPLTAAFTSLVQLVGVSRIYLGAHWFTDVVAGYLLGAALLAMGIQAHERWAASRQT